MSINIMPVPLETALPSLVLLHIRRENSAPARALLATLEALAQLEPMHIRPCLRRPLVGLAAEPELERLAVPPEHTRDEGDQSPLHELLREEVKDDC